MLATLMLHIMCPVAPPKIYIVMTYPSDYQKIM